MARSWAELLGEENAAPEPDEQRGRFFSRLRDSLSKSRRALTEQIAATAFDPSNEADWERLEEALIMGDVGVRATAELVQRLEARGDVAGNFADALAEEVAQLFGAEQTLDGAPHETLLVVDATTGQNGLQQARLFKESAGVTGVVLTKLDGSAKGGVAISIAYELGLPVKLVGVGEQLDDLRPFDAQDFARALVAA